MRELRDPCERELLLLLQTIDDERVVLRKRIGPCRPAIPFEIFMVSCVAYKHLSISNRRQGKAGQQSEAVGCVRGCVGALTAPQLLANVLGIERQKHSFYATIAV